MREPSGRLDVADLPEALAAKYLPDNLKKGFVVLPTKLYQWGVVNLVVCGVGLGMLIGQIVGHYFGLYSVALGFPIALILTWIISKIVLGRLENAFAREAGPAVSEGSDQRQ